MIGNKLQTLRKKNNLTQKKIADSLLISRSSYAQYEINNKRPSYETLVEIAKFYNVTTDYLLDRANSLEPYYSEGGYSEQADNVTSISFGKRLKSLRESRGLTQYQMSRCLGMNRNTLANWELERCLPDLESIRLLADYFNISTDYFLGRKELYDVIKSKFGLTQSLIDFIQDHKNQELINDIKTLQARGCPTRVISKLINSMVECVNNIQTSEHQ